MAYRSAGGNSNKKVPHRRLWQAAHAHRLAPDHGRERGELLLAVKRYRLAYPSGTVVEYAEVRAARGGMPWASFPVAADAKADGEAPAGSWRHARQSSLGFGQRPRQQRLACVLPTGRRRPVGSPGSDRAMNRAQCRSMTS